MLTQFEDDLPTFFEYPQALRVGVLEHLFEHTARQLGVITLQFAHTNVGGNIRGLVLRLEHPRSTLGGTLRQRLAQCLYAHIFVSGDRSAEQRFGFWLIEKIDNTALQIACLNVLLADDERVGRSSAVIAVSDRLSTGRQRVSQSDGFRFRPVRQFGQQPR